MPVVYSVVGGTSPSGAWLRPKVSPAGASVSALVSTTSNFSGATSFGPVTATSDGIASITVTGLLPNTQYFYQIVVDGTPDNAYQGAFRTFPIDGSPADFRVALSSCAGLNPVYPGVNSPAVPTRISNHPVFTAIRDQDPLMFVHMGDMHYYNIGDGVYVPNPPDSEAARAAYLGALEDVFKQPNQHDLYRNVATAWMYDDHDWGPNDSHGSIQWRQEALDAYRERWPHMPLGDSARHTPNYQTWRIGRVRFVLLDDRADRDINATDDGPGKTMIGDTQRSWLRDVLTQDDTSGALVLITTSVWFSEGSDTWGAFDWERRELIDMFTETGWIDRMVTVYGDIHALGIETGTRSPGGIPCFQFAALDSVSGGSQNNYDTGPTSPGAGRWGTLDITDNGTFISINGTAWIGGDSTPAVWKSYTFTVLADSGTEEPQEPPPPPAVPELVPEVKWYGCRLSDGLIIEELRDVTGEISKVIGSATASNLSIPVPRSDPQLLGRVLSATDPRKTMVVAVINNTPVWGGYVAVRDRGTEATVNLSVVSFEGYFDRRYINRDYTMVQVDEADIFIRLMKEAETYSGRWRGLGMAIDAPQTGTKRDRQYKAVDHKKLLEVFGELMGVEDGPEWTVQVRWRDETQTSFQPVLVVRKKLGRRSFSPDTIFEVNEAIFESDGAATATYSFTEDSQDGKAANLVQAYSSGSGDDKPISSTMAAVSRLDAGEVIFEYHYQPSSSISQQSTLDSHAKSSVVRMQDGNLKFELETIWDAFPRLGFDWDLGDDVGWRLIGHGHPMGIEGSGRVVGWSLDPLAGKVKPILWDPEADEEHPDEGIPVEDTTEA